MLNSEPSTMLPNRKKLENNSIKVVQETPLKYTSILTPVNALSEKERFLEHGIAPAFVYRASPNQMNKFSNKPGGTVRHDLLELASGVLQKVCDKYGCGDEFIESNFGERIDHLQASTVLTKYLQEQGVDGQISILWSHDLDCSARITWHGPNIRYNKPEARRHTLVIKNSSDNIYLREQGIICLANHEIGTHYLRSINDGLQPWFSDRKKFGLRGYGSHDTMVTEEGLAALNTVVMANTKFLFAPALLYYTACKSTTMTFQELFDHLHRYVRCPEQRWKRVMRVKRSLEDPRGVGGNGFDQCYFQGAVDILRRIDDLDLTVLYSGCIGVDEVPRVHRLARTDCIKLPSFMADLEKYRKRLRQIGLLNGILHKQDPHHPQSRSHVRSSRQLQDQPRPTAIPRPPSEGAAWTSSRRPLSTLARPQRFSSAVSPGPHPGISNGIQVLSADSTRAKDTICNNVNPFVVPGAVASDDHAEKNLQATTSSQLDTLAATVRTKMADANREAPPISQERVPEEQRCDSAPANALLRASGFSNGSNSDDENLSGCCYRSSNSSAFTHFQSLLQRVSSHISTFVYCGSSLPSRAVNREVTSVSVAAPDIDNEKDLGQFYVQTLPPRRPMTGYNKR